MEVNMCDCEKSMAKKLTEHVLKEIEKEPGFQKINNSFFTNQTFVIASSGVSTAPIIIPFTVEYTRRAKTSGNVRGYKKSTFIKPAFCPFCGQAYNVD
jgi:hypothetical protein